MKRFFFRKITGSLSRRHVYLIKSLSFRQKPQALPVNADYVRYSTLGLVYEEIIANKIAGNVAEVGVYQGDFSKRLNLLFNDRKLYLFDTFEGFSARDISIDKDKDFSTGDQNFSDTSVDFVRSKMPYPDQCIFKKGFFPDTAAGIDDEFCFVSLDTDLYQPLYEGLKFFYPRLARGGYIFIHDFNNESYKGAREAVVQYCRENKIGYVPLPDSAGTAVICK